MRLELDTSEAEEFVRALRLSRQEVRDELGWGTRAACMLLEGELVEATPHGATGNAAAAWTSTVESKPSEILGLTTNQRQYLDTLNRGSKAGPWRTMPPWQTESAGLWLWAKRKLHLPAKEAKRAAYLIARKILKKGFTDRHEDFADKTFGDARARMIRLLDQAAERAMRRI